MPHCKAKQSRWTSIRWIVHGVWDDRSRWGGGDCNCALTISAPVHLHVYFRKIELVLHWMWTYTGWKKQFEVRETLKLEALLGKHLRYIWQRKRVPPNIIVRVSSCFSLANVRKRLWSHLHWQNRNLHWITEQRWHLSGKKLIILHGLLNVKESGWSVQSAHRAIQMRPE